MLTGRVMSGKVVRSSMLQNKFMLSACLPKRQVVEAWALCI